MSDERQAFEQLHAIPSGVEWCEKRHIYIHKNYSGLVLHPINESWKAFCEGALWQASREAASMPERSELIDLLISTRNQSEGATAEYDGDFEGLVWVNDRDMSLPKYAQPRVHWSRVRGIAGYTHWIPTNLVRPEPRQQEQGHE